MYPTRENVLKMLDMRIELLKEGESKKELEWARLIISQHFINNP